MSKLAIINSNSKIKKMVKDAFNVHKGHNYELIFLTKEDEIMDYISYALPELAVINFSDEKLKIDKIVNHIENDKWVLNLGIVGIFSHEKDNEENLMEKYKTMNVLAQLEYYRIKSHLVKNIQIIEQNFQILFQREFTKSLLEGASGSFIIDNDLHAVSLYSSIGATILAQRGLINPDNKMRLQLALAELIVNGIEHGNCGITYEEKSKSLENGTSANEQIAEKCKDPVINAKKVTLNWEIMNDSSVFIIEDEGEGFDVKAHIEKVRKQDKYSAHGRGIKMASTISNKLKYNTKGNQVAMTINHDTTVEQEVPLGFSKEQIVHVKKGDIVLKEGDPSDYLYYISSGTFEVLHKGKPVGTLSPQDIFMGEMSFLLSQRRSATIRATSTGKLVLLTQKNFINVIREYRHYGIFLSKLIAKRLVRTNEQAASRYNGNL
jgi:anti-sigma regulatory factor (Ser/Thr protein kinase)